MSTTPIQAAMHAPYSAWTQWGEGSRRVLDVEHWVEGPGLNNRWFFPTASMAENAMHKLAAAFEAGRNS
jgi:hypothetical protein